MKIKQGSYEMEQNIFEIISTTSKKKKKNATFTFIIADTLHNNPPLYLAR